MMFVEQSMVLKFWQIYQLPSMQCIDTERVPYYNPFLQVVVFTCTFSMVVQDGRHQQIMHARWTMRNLTDFQEKREQPIMQMLDIGFRKDFLHHIEQYGIIFESKSKQVSFP